MPLPIWILPDLFDMTTTLEPPPSEIQTPRAETHRIGTILRWAARLTSVPVFGLLLTSLIPAVASFGISAKDDRIIALGMCVAALGFLMAWRWPGIGGAMAAVGVGAMLSQAEGSILGDPFSIAFGLQAILFLISWALNSPSADTKTAQFAWLKKAAAGSLVVAAGAGAIMIVRGAGPTPVPKEKEAYTGVWESAQGFQMEITPNGRARISQEQDAKVEPCNTPLRSSGQRAFLITFPTDDRLLLASGVLTEPKLYHIDRRPFREGKATKMVLNGSDPYKPGSAMVLVKKQTPVVR